MFGRRFLAALVMAGSALGAGQGLAQEDLNKGKSPTQLYASDCADCHKNARALGQRDNAGKLADFLRVHYTASRETAAAIAQYLVSLGPEPKGVSRPSGTARPKPAAEQGKPEPGKAAAETAKPAEGEKPAEAPSKPAEPAQEKAAPAPAAPPASEPAPAAPAAAPASPPADPQ